MMCTNLNVLLSFIQQGVSLKQRTDRYWLIVYPVKSGLMESVTDKFLMNL